MSDEIEALEALQNSEAKWRLDRIEHFGLSVQVFHINVGELVGLIDQREHPTNALPLRSRERSFERYRFSLMLIAKLHNFVSAAKSLVDHAHRFRDQLESAVFKKRYNRMAAECFRESPLVGFINDLRQYAIHCEVLPMSVYEEWSPSPRFEVCLPRDYLASKKDRWHAPAKRYLETAPERIALRPVVVEYVKQIDRFYDEVKALLREEHADDLREVETLEKAYRAARTPRLVEGLRECMRRVEAGKQPPNNVPSFYLAIDTVFRLKSSCPSDEESSLAILEELCRRYELPSELVDSYRKAIRMHYGIHASG